MSYEDSSGDGGGDLIEAGWGAAASVNSQVSAAQPRCLDCYTFGSVAEPDVCSSSAVSCAAAGG